MPTPSVSIPPFHNPNNLTPAQYGASDGWRLLRESEIVPPDGERLSFGVNWVSSNQRGVTHAPLSTYRTRQPDPFAPADSWVKMSERKPTADDLPILAYDGGGFGLFVSSPPLFNGWTHWKPFRETPPARELTQAENDDAAFEAAKMKPEDISFRSVWHAALAYERGRVSGK